MDERATQDRVAHGYGTRYRGNGLLYHQCIITEMVQDFLPSARILDVGCGTGIISALHPNLDLRGVDFSHEMIRRNPHKCQLGDAEHLPFKDEEFDGVLCRGVLHHLTDPASGVAEISRVLRPGGQAVFLETNRTWLSALPRRLFQYTPWFSKQHKNFSCEELRSVVSSSLHITTVGHRGYLAYALCGFPDIISLPMPRRVAQWLVHLDAQLSRSPLQRLGFNTLLRAHKRSRSSS